jgi:PAS domain S-box-containing protein
MSENEISREDILDWVEAMLKGEYDPLRPDHREEGDAALVRRLNACAQRVEEIRDEHSRRLREEHERLEQVLREAPIGICVTDENGYFVEANPAYCRLYGYSREELIGSHFTIVVPPENQSTMMELHDRFMGQTYELSGEWDVQHRDGSPLSIMATAAYLVDDQGQPRKVTFVVDITARKQSERELNRTVQALQREIEERSRLEKTRDRVERMVRHDLKNPLSAILGASQLLSTGQYVADTDDEIIAMIADQGKRLLAMLDGMFDYLKMEEGTYSLHPEAFELGAFLHSLVLGTNSVIERRSLQLDLRVDDIPWGEYDPAEPVYLWGERRHLLTLFENLVRNAVDASPPKARISFNVHTGERVLFDLHNQGVIPEEVRDRFFDRYVTAGKEDGTGLGTYIAKLICDQHGGEISFTTDEAEGTHLYVTLPTEAAVPTPNR